MIGSVNETDNRITLMGGDTFELTDGTYSDELSYGDLVEVTWYQRDNAGFKEAFDVDMVEPAAAREANQTAAAPQGDTVRGTVAEVDETNNRVTLANGEVFALGAAPHATDLAPGDIVEIKWWQRDEDNIKLAYDVERVHETAATVPSAGAAPPQGTRIEGIIADVNHTDNRITLVDGATFTLGTGEESSAFAPGQRVALMWSHWRNGFRVADNAQRLTDY